MKKWTGAAIDWFRLVEFRMARGKDAFRFVDASRTCSIFAWKLICGGVWPARESENLKNSTVSVYDDSLYCHRKLCTINIWPKECNDQVITFHPTVRKLTRHIFSQIKELLVHSSVILPTTICSVTTFLIVASVTLRINSHAPPVKGVEADAHPESGTS